MLVSVYIPPRFAKVHQCQVMLEGTMPKYGTLATVMAQMFHCRFLYI